MSSMNTIPMLNICTPPPDIYNMNACMGSCFAGLVAKSHARFSLIPSNESFVLVAAISFLPEDFCVLLAKNRAPGLRKMEHIQTYRC